ncbi:MAG: PorV/PorQ family protein [Elusimicrobiales bacterium]|nr:PorV/PorQ family protein [Elusimicrobiales bacterium]
MTGKGKGSTICLLAALAALASAVPSRAADIYPSAGSTSATFLKLGAGARALAMGGAFTSVCDPYSAYWNPAGLACLGAEKNFSFFHNEYFQGLGQEYLLYTAPAAGGKALGVRLPAKGAWAFGLNYFYVPRDLERRSGLYEADPVAPISPVEGKFGASDAAVSAAYGRGLGRGYSGGLGLKVIRQSIDGYSGVTLAADLGAARDFFWRGQRLRAGLALVNLGPGIKLDEERFGLPLSLRAGLSGRLEESGALVSVDAEKPVDDYLSLALGAEYPLTSRLMLRTGYRARHHGNELGAWSGFSAGAGVSFDKLTFDYALTPFGDLGTAHRFSLTLRFGEAAARRLPRPAAVAPLPGGTPFVYGVTARPLALARTGVRYELRAESPASGLAAIAFKTLLRDEPPGAISVLEGPVPAELPLPEGLTGLLAWQPAGFPGAAQGDAALLFKLKPEALASGKLVFLYREGGEWRRLGHDLLREDGGYLYFSAEAPCAAYYAAALER